MSTNPLIAGKKVGKYEAFPLDELKTEHFLPAVKEALQEAKQNIEKIRKNKGKANFENTILALETSSEKLDEVTTLYFNLMGMESDDEFKALAQEISPLLSAFRNEIMTDAVLFDKVKTVYNNMADLNEEQKRLVDQNYKSFTRNGALLNDEDKKKLLQIDRELSKLSPKFAQNVLGATNAFQLHITDKKELEGIPESALDAAEYAAEKKGYDSGWLFTLQIPSLLPVLKFAKNRKLREKMNRAFGSRAYKDKFDNREILKKIASLRYQRAKLLGFKNHAEYVLKERMAETPEKVKDFLDRIKNAAKPVAIKEVAELQQLAKEEDGIEKLQSWDSTYYSEKLKQKKFDFDEEKLRPYFKMENVVEGLFKVANKLYGVKFEQLDDVPVYHEDVKVFKVTEGKNEFVGLLYVDLFPRETKNSGAWMTTFRTQGLHYGELKRPHAAVVANLTPSTKKKPSLLNLNEVTTLFHEFGHSLHALLSNCTYASLASPK
ncbi:MAG TPA: peptidase M3, partial [Candidatus Cloacimonas sp.]|nr:peptidase M3 [Candidatus Cloacimonas sp.]